MRKAIGLAAAFAIVVTALTASAQKGTLADGNRLMGEKSYQLAADAFEAVLAGNPDPAAKREATYKLGLAKVYLRRADEGRARFEELTAGGERDVWAGRAHWQLEPNLAEPNRYWGGETSQPLEHLRIADEILTDLKPNDLADFYRNVAFTTTNRPMQEEKDRAYLFGFFDRLMPLLTTDDARAEALLRKAPLAGYVAGKPAEDETLRQYRAIISEFPKTRSAPQAQMAIAQLFLGKNDLVAALKEFEAVTDKYPQTEESKSAATQAAAIRAEQVQFQLGSSFLPGEPIKFELRARNVGEVRLSAIPFDPVELLRQQRLQRFDLDKVRGEPAHSMTVAMERRDDYQATTTSVEFELSKPGAYVLRGEAGSGKATSLLLISDLMLVANTASHALEFWAVDAKTGRPRPGTKITIGCDAEREQTLLGHRGEVRYTRFETLSVDDEGFADFTRIDKHSQQHAAVAQSGDNYAFFDNTWWYPQSRQKGAVAYIATDRPVYRPEQTVYWRVVVRDRDGGDFALPAEKSFTVEINDPRSNNVLRQENLKADEFGAISGEFKLGEQPPLGPYSIAARDQSGTNYGYGQGAFRVEEYKKPEYEVKVAAGDSLYKLGADVEAKLDAKYYFGAPVAEAQVKYTVRRRPHFIPWWWSRGGGGPDDDGDLGWFDRTPQEPNVRHGSQGDIVASGEGKTDAEGRYIVKFKAEVPPPDPQPRNRRNWFWQEGRTFDFQIEATVTDKSRRNIDASQVIVVSDRALQLAAAPQQNLYTPGDLAKVKLRSRNFNDEPVATSGTLYIEKVVWNATEEKEECTTLTSMKVDVPASGTLLQAWRVPDGVSGRMRALFEVQDPFGLVSYGRGEFTVADENTRDIQFKYQGVEIIPDRDIYSVGETARILVLSKHADAQAWYWIDSGTGNLEKRVMPLTYRTNLIKVPITEAFVPNSMLHIVVVRDKQVISDQKELIVPPVRKVITVTVSSDKESYKPGEEGVFDVTARDWQGKPVRTQFSLSIYDRSILYIAPDTRDDIRRFFYGARRQLQSNLMNSGGEPGGYNKQEPQDQLGLLFRRGWIQRYDLGGGTISQGDVWRVKDGAEGGSFFAMGAAPVPASASPMASRLAMSEEKVAGAAKMVDFDADGDLSLMAKTPGAPEESLAAPALRTDFRDSMYWTPAVVTDANGHATIRAKFPDSLTTWHAVAVGLTPETLVGNAEANRTVKKNLLARLEAPRFFRERDRITLSGIVHNYLPSEKEVRVRLSATGVDIETTATPLEQTVRVPAGGEKRVEWSALVSRATADATLKLEALTAEESDAMQLDIPVLPHGIDKFVAWNGSSEDKTTPGLDIARESDTLRITRQIDLPAERIESTARLTVVVNPSLAFAIRDAIPYMVDYPYGCVEQTMSRFMPATVAAAAFRDLGMPADEAMQRKLAAVTAAGLQRLADFQHPDGSWGWWKDDDSNIYMTALVMHGLTLAREADAAVDAGVFSRGMEALKRQVAAFDKDDRPSPYWRNNNLHALAQGLLVLALNGERDDHALAHAWDKRDDLAPQGLAMLARVMKRVGREDDAKLALRNLENFAVHQAENDTVRWGRIEGCWYWWDDAVEATAQGLLAYLEIAPDDPAAARAMKWLVLNREGRWDAEHSGVLRWKSTKDTAQAVLALTAYMKARRETAADMTVEVAVAGLPPKSFRITPDNFWKFDGRMVLEGDAVPVGKVPVVITQTGKGTLFYSVFAEYFTLEENIAPAGNEIFVERKYEKLVRKPVAGKPAVVAEDTYVPLRDGDAVQTGDELRVTLKIKSLNDYEYLVFEDAKAAGMEPVALQSGTVYAGFCSNMELRDEFVSFFVTYLKQGEHTVSYNCRAEFPGVFHAMPTRGYAMYSPALRANSGEIIVTVKDAEAR